MTHPCGAAQIRRAHRLLVWTLTSDTNTVNRVRQQHPPTTRLTAQPRILPAATMQAAQPLVRHQLSRAACCRFATGNRVIDTSSPNNNQSAAMCSRRRTLLSCATPCSAVGCAPAMRSAAMCCGVWCAAVLPSSSSVLLAMCSTLQPAVLGCRQWWAVACTSPAPL